jgi:ABC-type antimicrobial peptide transport system permease subunit
MSLALFHSIQRLGDIGVMMAVGGNRLGCIWLHSLVILVLLLPAAVLGFTVGLFFTQPPTFSSLKEIQAFLIGLSFIILICFAVSFPTIGLTTFIDPYRAIRRQR